MGLAVPVQVRIVCFRELLVDLDKEVDGACTHIKGYWVNIFHHIQNIGTVETDSLTASTQVFATLQRRTIEEWPFCEQNTLLGFTALFTHHNYPPHFEEVGANSFGVGFA